MAELALDLSNDGLYMHAQELRNTATHRFPLVHLGWREIVATDALVPVTVEQAVAATRHALSVARSAYLYVVATLDMIENRMHSDKRLALSLPDQRKMNPADVSRRGRAGPVDSG